MLSLEGVSLRYRGGAAVTDLTLQVAPGEIVALIGLNGAGKTTLMRLALGMLRPRSGEALLDGTPVGRLPAHRWGDVGHLVESPLAYPELTVTQNLWLSAQVHAVAPERVVPQALVAWDLTGLRDRRHRRLSLGNKQRVGLAGALQHHPRLVVLDEPSIALDPAAVLILRDQLKALAQDGAGILVSSHHLDEVARVADRIVLMNRGHLIGELSTDTSDLESAFFDRVHIDVLARKRSGEAA